MSWTTKSKNINLSKKSDLNACQNWGGTTLLNRTHKILIGILRQYNSLVRQDCGEVILQLKYQHSVHQWCSINCVLFTPQFSGGTSHTYKHTRWQPMSPREATTQSPELHFDTCYFTIKYRRPICFLQHTHLIKIYAYL